MNTRILAVDDEESILQIYTDVLGDKGSQTDSIIARRKRRQNNHTCSEPNKIDYEIFLAQSGEKAIEIVQEQMAQGNHIAAGFFDMKMPGGIDGLETIKEIKKLDPGILVAVVTAYTDRTVEQIGQLFESQDEWIYFNKPFTHGELKQTALHLVTSWDTRREIGESKRTLRQILDILKKSRFKAKNLIETLPPHEHIRLLENWLSSKQRDMAKIERVIKQTLTIMKEGRNHAEDLAETLPKEVHIKILENWINKK